jgi:hypothetical protein
MAAHDTLLAELLYGENEIRRLAAALADRKRAVYVDTLAERLRHHGSRQEVTLSRSILAAIDAAAMIAAREVVQSYNRDLRDFVARWPLAPARDLLNAVEEWSIRRADWKAPQIAVTETYDAHVDALVSFYRDNGRTPEFDFGGHGDAEPACAICKAIRARNPWSYDGVVRIGVPHPQCRQEWHPRDVDMPEMLVAGLEPAGILGSASLMQRASNQRDTAVALVETL